MFLMLNNLVLAYFILVDGVVGLLDDGVVVNIFWKCFSSHFVLVDLFHFKGKLCQIFRSPKLGNFFLTSMLYEFLFSLFSF